ncbi:MAG: nucleotidyltransferase domain-containing protein [bacterium]
MQLFSLQQSECPTVEFVVLFGSTAKATANATSDVDIAVKLFGKPKPADFVALFTLFSEKLPGKNVDLRFLNDADLIFAFEVVSNGTLYYGDEASYQQYRLLIAKMYVDDGVKYFPFKQRLLQRNQEALESALGKQS